MAAATPQSFIDEMRPWIRNRPVTTAEAVKLLNQANDFFAGLAAWRWLCRAETPITITGAQEYTWTGSDVHKVIAVYISEESNFAIARPLASVPTTGEVHDIPSFFAFSESGTDRTIRFWPKPTGLSGKAIPISKLAHTRVTSGNIGDADVFEWPDEYAYIFSDILLDYAYELFKVGPESSFLYAPGNAPQIRGPLAKALIAVDFIRPNESVLLDRNAAAMLAGG